MLKTSFAVTILFLSRVAVGDEEPPQRNIEMTFDRLGDSCTETTEGDGLTTCYVKSGTTVPFYGSLTIYVENVDDLVVDLKWKALGKTSISRQQMCLLDGQTVISNNICKNISKEIIRGYHHFSKVYYMVKVPANGELKNDTITLSGTVTWDDNLVDKDYVIEVMKVVFI